MSLLKTIQEPAREVPVVGEYDVIVCGGGTSGIPAAVSAARDGAKVMLVERYGFLGGVASYNIMPAWHQMHIHCPPLRYELAERVKNIGGPDGTLGIHMDPEYVKKAVLDMILEAGVELNLHSIITEVVKEGNVVKGVISESKSGRRAYLAKVIIDATGDGDIAYLAGAEYMKGNKEGITQGMTLRFRIGNIDFDKYFDWISQNRQYYNDISDTQLALLRSRAKDGKDFYLGSDLSELYKKYTNNDDLPVLSYFNGSSLRKNEFSANATRVYNVDGSKQEDLTYSEVECRKQQYVLWNFLKGNIPGFDKSEITETAPQIGVRETRRIVGDYVLTEAECREGKTFDDTVVKNSIAFDLHDAKYTCEVLNQIAAIPYRCLLPKGLESIIVVGRCISSDHVSNSSIRSLRTAFDLGQAGGLAAAIAARDGLSPRAVSLQSLREAVIKHGLI